MDELGLTRLSVEVTTSGALWSRAPLVVGSAGPGEVAVSWLP
jgi:hypothetical protein